MEISPNEPAIIRKRVPKKVVATRLADNEERIGRGDEPGDDAAETTRSDSAEVGVSSGLRRQYVEVAAYFIAEKRGFCAGGEQNDWVLAEREIERMIAGGNGRY
jgi:hypothetical protein